MKQTRRSLVSKLIVCMATLCMMAGLFQAPSFAEETETVNLDILTASGWSGYGFTVDSSWGKFSFENWEGYGSYIYNDYDFTGDFTFLAKQSNIFGNTANILFCYQDNQNYYQLTLGTSNSLSKVVNGTSTNLASDSTDLSGAERSYRIDHAADGTITVSYGDAGTDGTANELFSAVDTDLTSGKMGLSYHNGGGYFAIMNFSGTVIKNETPEETGDITYSENFDSITTAEANKWINVGQNNMTISNGTINGSDWSGMPAMIYTGISLDTESYTYSVDLKQNYGNGAANSASVLFNYDSYYGANGAGQKGYAVEVAGGDEKTVYLKKYTDTLWAGVETLATYTHTESLKNKNMRVEVTYKNNGKIYVNLTVDGTTYENIFGTNVKDIQFRKGHIGVMKAASQFAFDNISLVPSEDEPIIATMDEINASSVKNSQKGTIRFAYQVNGEVVTSAGACVVPLWLFENDGDFETNGKVITVNKEIFEGKTYGADVTGIPAKNFDTVVCSKPFVAIGKHVKWGEDVMKASVNSALNTNAE